MASLSPVRPALTAVRGGLSRLGGVFEALAEAERDQFPLWLPVGLLGGIGAWFWLPAQAGWIGFVASMAALALGALATMRMSRWGPALAWFAGAAAFGCVLIWWTAERVAAPRAERAQAVEITGTVEAVQPLAAERLVRVVVAPEGEGQPARVRVNIDEALAPQGLAPGARVRFEVFLMPPAGPAAPGRL